MVLNNEVKDEQKIIIGGIIDTVKEITTKKGKHMAFVTLTDFTGTIEGVVFPKTYESNKHLIVPDTIIAIQAIVSDRDGQKTIILNGMKKLEK